MAPSVIILWLALLAYLSWRAARMYTQKRFGFAIAMTALILLLSIELMRQWHFGPMGPAPPPPGPGTPQQQTAPGDAPPPAGMGQTQMSPAADPQQNDEQ